MAYQIGFMADYSEETTEVTCPVSIDPPAPRRSLVQVKFPNGPQLSYYNDLFDLHPGNMVFVEGKYEGVRGRVTSVNYNFRIKLSDYKKVVSVADTDIHGQFAIAGSHFVTFSRSTLPKEEVKTWFWAPCSDEEEFVSGDDGSSVPLDDLSGLGISSAIAERGHDYYMNNHVHYLCIDGEDGYAIVSGSKTYEVEFKLNNGAISSLTCTCPCGYTCKHEFAALLQLKETLDLISSNYPNEYKQLTYFAAIDKSTFFQFVVDSVKTGYFTV